MRFDSEMLFHAVLQVRAGIRTFKPKEAKLVEVNPKFNKKVGVGAAHFDC